jgi:hypothetical protein
MATATLDKTATFMSKGHNYTITLDPADFEINSKGRPYNRTPGARVTFEKNVAELEADGDSTKVNGEVIDLPFDEVVEALRANDHFNTKFWEQGNPPEAPRPTVAEQMKAIIHAQGDKDVAALKEVLDTEQSTHQREEVLASVREALASISKPAQKK